MSPTSLVLKTGAAVGTPPSVPTPSRLALEADELRRALPERLEAGRVHHGLQRFLWCTCNGAVAMEKMSARIAAADQACGS
jgi:hypothetical protein